MIRLWCMAIGYVFGLFQTGYILGRMHGIDIREHGSGNAGTTNTLRTIGARAGFLTYLGDCLKCLIAVLLVRFLFRDRYPDMLPLLGIYTAAGTILGHNFPFYLGFRGGKGIAATCGMILSFHPIMWLCGAVLFFTTFLTTHYVSLGSLVLYVGVPIEFVVLGQLGFFSMTQAHLIELYVVAALLTVLAFWKHRENISRLIHGTERKTQFGSRKK